MYINANGGMAVNDGIFSVNEITLENISQISKKQSSLLEMRICELSEIALDAVLLTQQMLNGGYNVYEVLSVLSEGITLNSKTDLHEQCLPQNLNRVSAGLSVMNAQDKIILSELYVILAREKGIFIKESDFLNTYFGDESFTYVKNPLADEAYDVFSQQFLSPTVKYSKNLSEAGKRVSLGEVEYCLLPLEEKGGARLSSVAELLFRDDLKINSVIPVFGFEGNADMKYALVSKHFSVPEMAEDDDRYLEIRLRSDASAPLNELLLAVDSFGASLYRLNTLSFDTDEGPVQHYSIVFRDEKKDFVKLLVYLTLFSGAYTPVGIYKNLE